MRLLLFYLILTGIFLFSVNSGSLDYRNPEPDATTSGFYAVEQDGTITAATLRPPSPNRAYH
ncbi:MAG: hypothetical protein ACNA8K_08150 [Cyclonatronaceae bacterium]